MAQKTTWFAQAFASNRGMLKPGKRDTVDVEGFTVHSPAEDWEESDDERD